MLRVIFKAFIATVFALGFSVVVKAMPFGNNQVHVSLVVPVADGCGFNKYRDPRGVCRRKYVLGDHYGRRSLYGACGGGNSHRVCNLFGQCWMVCD